MIIDSYDITSEPIIKLENFYGEKQHLVKKCMVIFSKVIYEYMLEKFPCRQIAEVRACNGNIPVWTLPYEGETIAFYLTPIGSTLAAGTIAEVNHLTGASTFIMFGSCGSLDKGATDGKFILPTEAYRGEGLSYYFAEPQDYIKIKNTDKLAEFFKERKSALCAGKSMDDRQYASGDGKSCKTNEKKKDALPWKWSLQVFRRSVIFMDLNCMIFLLREMC